MNVLEDYVNRQFELTTINRVSPAKWGFYKSWGPFAYSKFCVLLTEQ